MVQALVSREDSCPRFEKLSHCRAWHTTFSSMSKPLWEVVDSPAELLEQHEILLLTQPPRHPGPAPDAHHPGRITRLDAGDAIADSKRHAARPIPGGAGAIVLIVFAEGVGSFPSFQDTVQISLRHFLYIVLRSLAAAGYLSAVSRLSATWFLPPV
jgi:hypothetical protein